MISFSVDYRVIAVRATQRDQLLKTGNVPPCDVQSRGIAFLCVIRSSEIEDGASVSPTASGLVRDSN